MSERTSSRRLRVGLALALLALALLLMSAGAYATFTSDASDSQALTSGTLSLALGAVGAETNRLTVAASNIAPGATIERTVDLINDGTLPLGAVTLTTSALTSSLLDQDATDGLQMEIAACSVPWTESGVAPAYVYSCSGSTSSVLSSLPIIGSDLSLNNLTPIEPGATVHLLLTLSLPTIASNLLQGLTSTVQYAFTGVQGAASND